MRVKQRYCELIATKATNIGLGKAYDTNFFLICNIDHGKIHGLVGQGRFKLRLATIPGRCHEGNSTTGTLYVFPC
jgi:hypothetical protein